MTPERDAEIAKKAAAKRWRKTLDLSDYFRENASLGKIEGIAVSDSLQERLDLAFPSSTDSQLVQSVQQGILLADGIVTNEPWLSGPMSRDVRGYLRRAGILSRVHAACVAGNLPFTATLERMPRGPFHWVEIGSNEFTAHICRTDGPTAFPDDTPTRQDERVTNQPDLFDRVVPLRGTVIVKRLFAWLSFGVPSASTLSHLCWAMPSADGKTWLARTNVLRRLAVADVRVESERPSERAVLKFRDEIADALSGPGKTALEGDKID